MHIQREGVSRSLTRLMHRLVSKLRQNPEFYNIRYYKKADSRKRNSQVLW